MDAALEGGVADVVIDPSWLTVRSTRANVRLTPREWQLLVMLLESGGEPVSKGQLARGIWGVSAREEEVEVYVCRLRRKLDRLGLHDGIETIRQGGYRATLTAEVRRADGASRYHGAMTEARRQVGDLEENLSATRSQRAALRGIRYSLHAASNGPGALPAPGPGVVRAGLAPLRPHRLAGPRQGGRGTACPADQPTLVLDGRSLTVEFSGRAARMTPTEWQLLVALLQAGGRPLDRCELATRAWATPVREKEVETYICRVRRKLSELGAPGCIETVRGVGYRTTMSVAPRDPIPAPSRRPPVR